MENVYYIPVETLSNFMRDVLLGVGVSPEDAAICTDVILASDLRGIESHGIGRLEILLSNASKPGSTR